MDFFSKLTSSSNGAPVAVPKALSTDPMLAYYEQLVLDQSAKTLADYKIPLTADVATALSKNSHAFVNSPQFGEFFEQAQQGRAQYIEMLKNEPAKAYDLMKAQEVTQALAPTAGLSEHTLSEKAREFVDKSNGQLPFKEAFLSTTRSVLLQSEPPAALSANPQAQEVLSALKEVGKESAEYGNFKADLTNLENNYHRLAELSAEDAQPKASDFRNLAYRTEQAAQRLSEYEVLPPDSFEKLSQATKLLNAPDAGLTTDQSLELMKEAREAIAFRAPLVLDMAYDKTKDALENLSRIQEGHQGTLAHYVKQVSELDNEYKGVEGLNPKSIGMIRGITETQLLLQEVERAPSSHGLPEKKEDLLPIVGQVLEGSTLSAQAGYEKAMSGGKESLASAAQAVSAITSRAEASFERER